jgi:hypothetical protein
MDYEELADIKNTKNDRTFVLEGTDNHLHAIRFGLNGYWKFKYEKGEVPMALKGTYTTFNKAREVALQYLKRKNINVKEIIR